MELLQSAICVPNIKGISRPKPSLFYYPGINSKPLYNYDISQSSKSDSLNASLSVIATELKDNYSVILNEYHNLRSVRKNDYKLATDEHKLHQGESWEWNSYILKGKRQADFAIHCPKTVEILESFQRPTLMSDVPFSYTFFSTLGKNTHIDSHYGPCNLRLRCHFPLIVPPGDCAMLLADQKFSWKEKEAIFFDDTYLHSGIYYHIILLFKD